MNSSAHNLSDPNSQEFMLILKLIEQKVGWRESSEWTGSDFELLSDKIYLQTSERLSITTLKRIWGRTSQIVKPSISTLNILARFLGHDSWRDFAVAQKRFAKRKEDVENKSSGANFYLVMGTSIFLLSAFLFWALVRPVASDEKIFDESLVSFSIEKVTIGIPNTVIFRYDLGGQNIDSIELQQTWDNSRRTRLDPDGTLATAIYLKPGYFNAKLVVDGRIVKTQNLYLPSNGFEVMFTPENRKARYLPSELWSLDAAGFSFTEEFSESKMDQSIDEFIFVNLLPEPVIQSDNFSAQASFRLLDSNNEDPCSQTLLILTGPESVYLFSMGYKGCSSDFFALLGGEVIDGKTKDLSIMGLEMNEEMDLMISKEDSEMRITVNGREMILSDNVPSIGLLGGFRLITSQKVELSEMLFSTHNQTMDFLRTQPVK